ncbi:MAG: MurR/RpiR family transcriptional regulator [Kiritimatiellae bacterium]|nr:MurR/RpiR family transcriptional regulator [Verrucomicrobiota bacterium]MBU4291703.1 MurR/RpiR family transcriptional regulator [Verrucomicrobiota bacterium]MCG2681296.1 MurR/RpiR family transcriptional regulator [Kiritimatiellia bacterium]
MKPSNKLPLASGAHVGGCLLAMKTMYPQLTRREKQIADYLRNHDDVIFQSITEVVRRSGVGYGTMMRFCRRLGCAGFQEFKIRLTQDLVRHSPRRPAGESLLEIMAARAKAELNDTLQLLSLPTIIKAARALAGARHVLCIGCGGSAVTAHEIEYRLSRLGIPAAASADNHMQRIRAVLLSARDVLFIVSASGSTKEVLAAGTLARQAGATVLGLTNFSKSPLVGLADITLVTASHANPLEAEIASRITMEFALDALCCEISIIKKDAARCILKTFKSVADRQW